MKTKILLSFCYLFVIASFAQDSAFQLKDYKYRTKGYRALTLSTSFGGGITNNKYLSGDSVKGKNFQLFPTSISYTKIISTDKRLSTSSILLNSNYNSHSNTGSSINNKYHYGNAYFKWQFDNRFFKNNNWFWQLGNTISSEGGLNKQFSAKDNSLGTKEELTLGFGKGRIEMVQDAQMALFILNDLKNQGLIDHQLNAETINSFAQLITEVNNRRIFDFRRKRIYELTQIDSFLREKGISNLTDIRHFTVINDNWAFAYNPLRSSGSDWFFHIVPFTEIDFGKINQSNYSSKSTISNFGARPEIGYENYKPVNLKWQRDMGSTLSWSYHRNNFNLKTIDNGIASENKTWGDVIQTRLYFFYGLSYYPNSRTRMSSNFSFTGSYFPYDKTYSKNEVSLAPSFNFSTDYFISYRTRLTVYLSTYYQYNRIRNTAIPSTEMHNLNINFGIGISHAFM